MSHVLSQRAEQKNNLRQKLWQGVILCRWLKEDNVKIVISIGDRTDVPTESSESC